MALPLQEGSFIVWGYRFVNGVKIVYTINVEYDGQIITRSSLMAAKAMNLKLEEERILDIKNVASVFHMTMTDVINEALDDYLPRMKRDPLYRLTTNVRDASAKKSKEILKEIESLTDDDLKITTRRKFKA